MHDSNLALYIHIPFCLHKCSYCDFYSVATEAAAIPARQFMDCVLAELASQVERFGLQGRTVRSIFFGGGTPSMLPAEELARLLETILIHFTIAPDTEITCEANPETLTLAALQDLRAIGVNRLSMGIQSFQPRHLAFLERVHSAERATLAARDIRRAGFTNWNGDLIYGLPDQTLAECADDLQRLIALAPTHISAYQLTVEERTPLAAKVRGGEVSMPDEELLLSMWEVVEKQLHDAGYAAYEISNFARPGFSCRHNRNYWEYGDYLGLGPGACTFLKKESDSFVGTYPQAFAFRFQRARNLHHYLAGQLDTDYEDPIPTEKAMGEYAMLALRTADGISEARFAELFHRMPHEVFADQFTEWQRAGWLIAAQEAGCHWRFSHHGRRIANTLCAQLF